MNPELQAQIDIEIEKADAPVRDFLRGDYFKKTISSIARVDKLSTDQIEALELEIILDILGLNDYTNFEEALQKELGSGEAPITKDRISSIVKDVNEYIFDQIRKDEKVPTENKVVKIKTSEADAEEQIKTELRKIIAKEGAKPKNEIRKIEYVPPKPIDYDIYREKPEEGDKILDKE